MDDQKPRLKDWAYYRTGGSCLNLHHPENIDELSQIMKGLSQQNTTYFVLGAGSNSLVMDEDWPGHVIVFDRMQRLELDGSKVYAEAGVDNSALSDYALRESLGNVSWMYRLPGQLGGTVRMNARCYSGEISQVVSEIHTVSPTGEIKYYRNDLGSTAIFRGYKDTIFMNNGELIAALGFQLKPADPVSLKSWMDHCEQDRSSKGQFLYPSCGCVFKNDYQVGVPSGMLLDRAGVHQLSHDTVEINPQHANFVFNKGASSRAILEMSFAMRELVYQQFGIWLQYEMEILGRIPADLAQKLQEQRPVRPKETELNALRQEFNARK